jgi:hypothetical protein
MSSRPARALSTDTRFSGQADRARGSASSLYADRLDEVMPGLGGRIETLTKARISHLLDRAEDPAETLAYACQQQIEDLQKVKQGIVDWSPPRSVFSSRRAAETAGREGSMGRPVRRCRLAARISLELRSSVSN